MTSSHGHFLNSIDRLWKNIRTFAFNNGSFFEMIFIIVYAFVQGIYALLSFYFPALILLFVGIFTIMVSVLFSAHRMIMISRIRILEKEVIELKKDKEIIFTEAQSIAERHKNMMNEFTKDLNSSKSLVTEKRGGHHE